MPRFKFATLEPATVWIELTTLPWSPRVRLRIARDAESNHALARARSQRIHRTIGRMSPQVIALLQQVTASRARGESAEALAQSPAFIAAAADDTIADLADMSVRMREVTREIYPGNVIRGWEHVVDADGAPVEFSIEACRDFLAAMTGDAEIVLDEIIAHATSPATFPDDGSIAAEELETLAGK